MVTLTNQSTLIREPRREHSRKPEAFFALVESLCPGRKLEMFSRQPRAGWVTSGIELDAAQDVEPV
jgi:N6-adenosine-specific RNA methylase IME4